MTQRTIRIGGASGSLRDSALAMPGLLQAGVDYLVFDFLAEGSMGMLALFAAADPKAGFAPDFLDVHLRPHLGEALARGVKLIANAGGVNPHGCAAAIAALAVSQGLQPRIAVVDGDDLRERAGELRQAGVREVDTGAPLPEHIDSMNAYLGAFPIAEALAAGADIVVTGRVVDSATTLGALIHEFGWSNDDYQRLAAGTLAGHLLECGAQVTGGTFTDWSEVPDWANIGYPIAECQADGTFTLTKPEGSGGLVTVGTVSEQLLYEIGDPQCYIVPDVSCDFSAVRLTQAARDRVHVSGARGLPPTDSYKVCTIHRDGWRVAVLQPILGLDAAPKAERQSAALFERSQMLLRKQGLGDWRSTHVELLGTEGCFGARSRQRDSREVVCRMVVEHPERAAVEIFAREQLMAIMGMSVGTTIGISTPVMPVQRLYSFLLDKREVTASVTLDGRTWPVATATEGGFEAAMIPRAAPPAQAVVDTETVTVPLVALAWARSGDKGDQFNVGVIARDPSYLPWINAALTAEAVSAWYAHTGNGEKPPGVERFHLPGLNAINLVVRDALGGGITSSPRLDPVAKSMAQQLLTFPIPIPAAMAAGVEGSGRG